MYSYHALQENIWQAFSSEHYRSDCLPLACNSLIIHMSKLSRGGKGVNCSGTHCNDASIKENNECKEAIPMACGWWIKVLPETSHYWCEVRTCRNCTLANCHVPILIVRSVFDLVLSSFPSLRKSARIHLSRN